MYKHLLQIKNINKLPINFKKGVNYELLTKKEIDYSNEEINDITNYIRLNNYSVMKEKLLNKTRHPIVNYKLGQWVDQQPNYSFKKAASEFANSIIYIDNTKLISTIEEISNSLLDNYENSVVILGKKEKSNYYFSLLIVAYIYEKYNKFPLSFSKNFISAFQKFGFRVTYVDIDDMMYTGSQTINLLFKYTKALKWSFHIEEKTHIDSTVNLLLTREYLKINKFNYKLVRLYMSTYAMNEIGTKSSILFPLVVITDSELIPTLEDSIIGLHQNIDNIINYLIIRLFYNIDYPSIMCSYFDYKIADLASTTAFPFLTGYIPSSNYINYLLEHENFDDLIYERLREFKLNNYKDVFFEFKKRIKINKQSDIKFINFIENCYPKRNFIENFKEIEFHEKYGIFQETKREFDNNFISNCPKMSYN